MALPVLQEMILNETNRSYVVPAFEQLLQLGTPSARDLLHTLADAEEQNPQGPLGKHRWYIARGLLLFSDPASVTRARKMVTSEELPFAEFIAETRGWEGIIGPHAQIR
jgi:hypothetical protein